MKDEFVVSQKGQSLITVALFLVGFIIMLALILDGGNAYLKRRQAQNAADSGALAGARVYCSDPATKYADAMMTATNYVIDNNAYPAPGYPQISGSKVTVGTTINFDSFFGNIIGLPDITANAIATAGCYGGCVAEGVLPVVWTCNDEGELLPGEINCLDIILTEEQYYNTYPIDRNPTDPSCVEVPGANKADYPYWCPKLTIVADNIDLDVLQCAPTGELDCDLNDDGVDDYLSGENRAWADLDGQGDAFCAEGPGNEGGDELSYWITDGYDCDFWTHTWVGDQSGNNVALYHAAKERRQTNPIVMFPVFDTTCPWNPDPTAPDYGGAGCLWDTSDPHVHPPDDIVHTFTNTPNYYHIYKISAFYITCVQTLKGECPGATKFYEENWELFHGGDDPLKGGDYNAIEGYFLGPYYVPGLGGKCDYDPNNPFTIYLDK